MLIEKPIYNWYAVYTKANGEKKLYTALKELGIESYLPLQKVLKYWSDRKKWVEVPLFRGYIFVKISYKEFFTVLNFPGAVCYVSFGGKAHPIPDYQINGIKKMIEGSEQEILISYQNIKKGKKAEVIYGSLKGVTGEIVEIHGQERIVIRLESMNCSVCANISRDEVRIIEEPEFQIRDKSENKVGARL